VDNLTHSFVGLGVGELVQRSLPPEAEPARQRTRHRLLLTACAVASNFPDLDLFLTRLLPAPLGYLLHHRGHTHTILFALPQALLLFAALWLLWPNARTLLRESRHARLGLALAIAAGFALHLTMDFLNSYGVHPFYPLNNGWFYGDMIFIVEPVFWVAFGVPLALTIGWPLLRWLALATLAGALAYFSGKGYLGAGSLAGLFILGAALAALRLMHMESRRALALALVVCAGYVAVQGTASQLGRQRIAQALQAMDPQSRVLDVAMTAFPAQTLCWSFVSVESNEAEGSYRLRRGLLSLAPAWMHARECPQAFRDPARFADTEGRLQLYSEWQGSLPMLRELAARDCRVNAWLRFARAPALDGDTGSDMRFAVTPRGNFTTLEVAGQEGKPCPGHVPPWGYPRADLLAPAL
jgi:inner membrane protein